MKKKILFVLSLLFGLMFINAGLDKFLHYMPVPPNLPEGMVKMMGAFNEIGWLLNLVGFAEIIGGVLFITNRFRALAIVTLFPILVGILIINITAAPSGIPIVLVLLAIYLWAMYEHRDRLLPLVR